MCDEQVRDDTNYLLIAMDSIRSEELAEVEIAARGFRNLAQGCGKTELSEFWNAVVCEVDGSRVRRIDARAEEIRALDHMVDVFFNSYVQDF